MKMHGVLAVFIALVSGCMSNGANAPNQPDNTIARELPLLRGNNRIGAIEGFNPDNPEETMAAMAARWQEAVDAGMSVARLQIDWPELEPAKNSFDKAALESRLEEMKDQGLQTFLLISAFDAGEAVVPEDLEETSFDDPEFIQRFKNVMDWVIPLLVEYDGYLISISNEAEDSFGEVSDLHNEILTFLLEVKNHIHQLDERMAVTVTFSEGSLGTDKPGIDEILAACDVASFNFYGGDFRGDGSPYYAANSEDQIISDIRRMLRASGDKNIVIQELGMWSGYTEDYPDSYPEETYLNSSEETQRRFFEIFFGEMQNHDRMRAAYVFQMVDWSPDTTQIFSDLLEEEDLDTAFINQFAETLNTMGLLRYHDGTEKAAWDEFIEWVEEFDSIGRSDLTAPRQDLLSDAIPF